MRISTIQKAMDNEFQLRYRDKDLKTKVEFTGSFLLFSDDLAKKFTRVEEYHITVKGKKYELIVTIRGIEGDK